MIKKVVFFNNWHFGDLHSNKEYVRQFMQVFIEEGIDVCYAISVNPRAVNLPITCVDIKNYPHLIGRPGPESFFDFKENIMYINTWVGHYMNGDSHNFSSQRDMWKDISLKIFVASDGLINIKLNEETMFYVSSIDYNFLTSVKIPEGKKILICNNIAQSLQSYTTNMENMINKLACDFPEYKIICTNKINSDKENVIFTDDLTNRGEIVCDLPEIGYISESCDVIVTNSSGPGTFSMTKKNFLDKQKKILAFVVGPGNTFWNGVDGVLADCSYYSVFEDDEIYNIVRNKINA